MSCEFCEDGRSLFGAAEDMGCMVEEIGIEGICYLPADKTEPPVDETVICITLPNGEARTRAINFCPMCGERLSRGKDGR